MMTFTTSFCACWFLFGVTTTVFLPAKSIILINTNGSSDLQHHFSVNVMLHIHLRHNYKNTMSDFRWKMKYTNYKKSIFNAYNTFYQNKFKVYFFFNSFLCILLVIVRRDQRETMAVWFDIFL